LKHQKRSSALVTGASRGIGRAIALELIRAGHEVYGVGRDEIALAETAQLAETPSSFHARVIDVRSAPEVAAVIAEPVRLELCINNAGVLRTNHFLDVPFSELREVFGTNVEGAFLVMQASARRMAKEGGGRIVNIASDVALKPAPGGAVYCASKHALAGLSLTLAEEMRDTNVQVTTVFPGLVSTEIFGKPMSPESQRQFMDPADLARVIVAALMAAGASVRIAELHLQPSLAKDGGVAGSPE
jgi:3-oxoacyl-[acyl-carrier protein] reductase